MVVVVDVFVVVVFGVDVVDVVVVVAVVVVFGVDVYSEIENCPASIVSSHRSFVCRADAIEVAAEDALCGKGYELTMFVFTDIMVIAKRKTTKGMGMMRSPSAASLAAGQQHVLPHKS